MPNAGADLDLHIKVIIDFVFFIYSSPLLLYECEPRFFSLSYWIYCRGWKVGSY
jgi:hypothetical protein